MRLLCSRGLFALAGALALGGGWATAADTPPATPEKPAPAAAKIPKPSDEAPKATKPPAKPADEAKPTEAAKTPAAKTTTAKPAEAAKSSEAKSIEPKPAAANQTAGDQADFDKVFADWRRLLGQMRVAQSKLVQTDPSEQEPVRVEYLKLVAQGRKLLPMVAAAAEKAFVADPKKNGDAADFLIRRIGDLLQEDKNEEALRLGKLLAANGRANDELYVMLGEAAFSRNDFAGATKYLKLANPTTQGGKALTKLIERADHDGAAWKKEQELREKETKADDLPRVKLTTSKGDISLELFENEAPNTVANFISLVEKGFYNGVKFHRVIPRFMAQTGDPKGDGSGGPGYTIADESQTPNHRLHFRGSLSMAKTEAADTAGSQFFITFVPTDHLNDKHTVFGRVLSGMDVVDKLQRTEDVDVSPPPVQDTILKAEVLRKRDHAYEPKTTPAK